MSRPFQVGDVVYAEGASAILGDVVAVEPPDEDGFQEVEVDWRAVTTQEYVDLDEPDLTLEVGA